MADEYDSYSNEYYYLVPIHIAACQCQGLKHK